MRLPGIRNRVESCSWPHAILSSEQERVLTDAISRYRPHIAKVARVLSRGDADMCRELDQLGCVQLWELGSEEIATRAPEHVESTLTLRMKEERRIFREEMIA